MGDRSRGLQRHRRRLELLHVTIRRARAPTAGARTDWPASPTTSRSSASRVALWNGRDPILKERLFGLTNSEGNHGEDVKEYYFYLDSTPTHSYMKYLYKYPQAPFPYADLVETSRQRARSRPRVRAARHRRVRRGSLLRRVRRVRQGRPRRHPDRDQVYNRGPEAATLHVLPTLWFRNRWRRRHGAARIRPCRQAAARCWPPTSRRQLPAPRPARRRPAVRRQRQRPARCCADLERPQRTTGRGCSTPATTRTASTTT